VPGGGTGLGVKFRSRMAAVALLAAPLNEYKPPPLLVNPEATTLLEVKKPTLTALLICRLTVTRVASKILADWNGKILELSGMETGCGLGNWTIGLPLTAATRITVLPLVMMPPCWSLAETLKVVFSVRPTGTRPGVGANTN